MQEDRAENEVGCNEKSLLWKECLLSLCLVDVDMVVADCVMGVRRAPERSFKGVKREALKASQEFRLEVFFLQGMIDLSDHERDIGVKGSPERNVVGSMV